MITVRDKDFRIVGFSRNLRGVISRSRRVAIERIDMWPRDGGGAQIGMSWVDGSSAIFDFVSKDVAEQFFASRHQRLGWPPITIST